MNLGNKVIEEHRGFLDQDPLLVFFDNEMIAYEVHGFACHDLHSGMHRSQKTTLSMQSLSRLMVRASAAWP